MSKQIESKKPVYWLDEKSKLKNLEAFSKELNPIVEQLNLVMKKYKIDPLKYVVRFRQCKDGIESFINYESFPSEDER